MARPALLPLALALSIGMALSPAAWAEEGNDDTGTADTGTEDTGTEDTGGDTGADTGTDYSESGSSATDLAGEDGGCDGMGSSSAALLLMPLIVLGVRRRQR
jgi:hypothetical protein